KLNQYYLFKPMIYGTGALLPSLGDLLINSLLFSWIIYFLSLKAPLLKNLRPFKREPANWAAIILISIVQVLATFGMVFLLHSLITDGQISFNVSNFFN